MFEAGSPWNASCKQKVTAIDGGRRDFAHPSMMEELEAV
jgi:hypothetical protein